MDPKRIKNLNLNIVYDEFSDILYVSFGDPRPGIATEVAEGDLVRTDSDSGEIVGVTILDFKERYMPQSTISIEESVKKIIPEVIKEFRD